MGELGALVHLLVLARLEVDGHVFLHLAHRRRCFGDGVLHDLDDHVRRLDGSLLGVREEVRHAILPALGARQLDVRRDFVCRRNPGYSLQPW